MNDLNRIASRIEATSVVFGTKEMREHVKELRAALKEAPTYEAKEAELLDLAALEAKVEERSIAFSLLESAIGNLLCHAEESAAPVEPGSPGEFWLEATDALMNAHVVNRFARLDGSPAERLLRRFSETYRQARELSKGTCPTKTFRGFYRGK